MLALVLTGHISDSNLWPEMTAPKIMNSSLTTIHKTAQCKLEAYWSRILQSTGSKLALIIWIKIIIYTYCVACTGLFIQPMKLSELWLVERFYFGCELWVAWIQFFAYVDVVICVVIVVSEPLPQTRSMDSRTASTLINALVGAVSVQYFMCFWNHWHKYQCHCCSFLHYECLWPSARGTRRQHQLQIQPSSTGFRFLWTTGNSHYLSHIYVAVCRKGSILCFVRMQKFCPGMLSRWDCLLWKVRLLYGGIICWCHNILIPNKNTPAWHKGQVVLPWCNVWRSKSKFGSAWSLSRGSFRDKILRVILLEAACFRGEDRLDLLTYTSDPKAEAWTFTSEGLDTNRLHSACKCLDGPNLCLACPVDR